MANPIREARKDNLLHLVRAYAAISAHLPSYHELEIEIATAYREASARRAGFDEVAAVLRGNVRDKDQIVRRVSWVSQHVLGQRAYCVGYQSLQRREAGTAHGESETLWSSALIEQGLEMGLTPSRHDLQYINLQFAGRTTHGKIDAVLFDQVGETIYVVKGCAVSQLSRVMRYSPESRPDLPLFPVERSVEEPAVSTASARGLLMARWILSAAFPRCVVKPLYFIVDDVDAGWDFQAHDLSDCCAQDLVGVRTNLSRYPVLASGVSWRKSGRDLDELDLVPPLAVKYPFSALPVDRATRSCMILNVLWEQQAGSERLMPMRTAEIVAKVRSQYMITYPADLVRHDIEDCLERGSFVDRPRYEDKMYALTPEGVAQILLMRRQLMPVESQIRHTDIDAGILSPIRKQAVLWGRYRDGIRAM